MKEYFVGIICLCSLCVNAQTIIDYHHQKYRIGDEIIGKQLVNQSFIWNLGDAKVIDDKHSVSYFDFNPETITCIENDGRIYFEQNESGISIAGYENPLSKVDFTLKEKWLPFPFSVGNQTSGYFCGKGKYCDKLFIREFGTYNTQADSVGTLILPNGDSIVNVLCVHSIRLKSIISAPIDTLRKCIPVFTEDSIRCYVSQKSFMLKDEEYRLYAVGSRYPIVSKKIESDYATGEIISNVLNYYSPEEQASTLPLDEANDYVRKQYQQDLYSNQENNKNATNNPYVFSYDSNSKQVSFLYQTDKDLNINLVIADFGGVIYKTKKYIATANQSIPVTINCSQLAGKEYILYITVNNDKYTEKIKIY